VEGAEEDGLLMDGIKESGSNNALLIILNK